MTTHGAWPTWPFTRLSPKEMARLLKAIEGQRSGSVLKDAPEAPL